MLTDCEDEGDERSNQGDRPYSEKLRLERAALPDMIEIVDHDHDDENPIQRSKMSCRHKSAPIRRRTSSEVSIRQSRMRVSESHADVTDSRPANVRKCHMSRRA